MSNIRVTKKQIDQLKSSAEVKIQTLFGKCTVVTVRLQNGFILTESSACVDPENYDEALGMKICLERIENKLWELEGYALQKQEYEKSRCVNAGPDFGWALDKMRQEAERVSGVDIDYLYEKDILEAKARNEANGIFFPVLDKEME